MRKVRINFVFPETGKGKTSDTITGTGKYKKHGKLLQMKKLKNLQEHI